MTRLCPRPFLRIAGFFLLVLLTAVPVSVSAASRYVFALNYIAGSISTYRADPGTGMLHHVRFTPTLQNPSSLVLRPDGRFLYVTAQSLDEIAIYGVDPVTGTLTEIQNSRVASGVRSNFRLAMSPDGKLLFVPGRFTSNLMVFRSDPETGELTPLETSNFPTHGKRARFVEVTADGRFVYVTNTVSGTIAAYRVDADSASVSPIEGMPFRVGEATVRGDEAGETIVGDSPQQAIVHPSGKFLYIPNWITGFMSAFRIDASTGVLTAMPEVKAETGIFPFSGSIHPNGKYLYIANWLSYDVSGFHINEETGQLSPMEGMPVLTQGDAPVNVMLDEEGRFAYVPNYHDSTLTVFRVDPDTGRLLDPKRIMTRPAVRRLAILEGEPVEYRSRWMLLADVNQETRKTTIRSYAVDEQTGQPTFVHGSELDGTINSLAIEQDTGLVFAGQDKNLWLYRMDDRGVLQKSKTDIKTDGDIQALYVDQRGRHLYVATKGPARFLIYEIDAQNAGLKEIQNIELPDDASPTKITSSPEQRLTFLVDGNQNRVFVFRFLTNDGPNYHQLTDHGSPFEMGKGLSDFVIDTTGRYGLAVQADEGTVTVYSMPTIWGPLKPVGKKPLSVGKHPIALVAHPGGEHLYVLDAGENRIHQLTLDTGTGKLSPGGEVISLSGPPRELTIDPSERFAYVRYAAQQGLTRFNINPGTGQLENPVQVLEGTMPSALAVTAHIK